MVDLDEALRDGLRELPVPEVSPDFDARVLQSLRASAPWWRRWWQPAKPLLAGASFSLVVTLALLHWTLSAPILPNLAPPQGLAVAGGGGPSTLAARPAPSLDALLDRPNLSAASLTDYWAARPPDPPDPPPPDRRPEPRRRAQVFCRACPIA